MYSITYIDSFSKIQFHFFLEIGLSQVDLLLGTKNVLSAKKRKTAFQTLRLDSYLRHRRLNERESLNLSSGTVALKNFQLNHICMLCSSLFCFLNEKGDEVIFP